MDIFKQKHYLGLVVILLVLLNLTTLTMLWIGRPERQAPLRGPRNLIEEQHRIQQLLKEELGFDEAQIEQYLQMRRKHGERVRQLDEEIRQLKKQMFDEVLQENPQPTLSDSLLKLTQEKQLQIERLTFQHFLDLKKICKPEQQDKLKLLMHEMFRRQPARHDDGQFPHPPDGERPPRRPPGNN